MMTNNSCRKPEDSRNTYGHVAPSAGHNTGSGFFRSRSGLPLLPLLAACVAGAACICMLLMKAGATPNAVSTPTALAGKSATVAGEILDSWDESGGAQGVSKGGSQIAGNAATAGDFVPGSEGASDHVTGAGNSAANQRPAASDLVPRARFHREVRLRSDADIETWAYILIEIPQVRAALEGEEPHMQDALMPCINSDAFVPVGASANDGVLAWIHALTGTDPQKNTVYLYRCRRPLGAGDTTPPLFSEVAVPDFSEAEALTGELSAVGWLIQAAHLDAEEADALARKWAGVRLL